LSSACGRLKVCHPYYLLTIVQVICSELTFVLSIA
jgi:hypothetical protein